MQPFSSVASAIPSWCRWPRPPEPDPPEPPFLWGDPEIVRERLGEAVEELVFESTTVLTPVLSPEHYWEKAGTETGLFIAAIEAIDEADKGELKEEMVETIAAFFDSNHNAVPMQYRLIRARVV